MNINIQDIVNVKIKDMEDRKVIEKTIEDTLEKTIIKAVIDAFDGYALKRDIEKKLEDQVSKVVSEIGFTAYNSFIAEKVKAITEGILHADISEKIQKTFDSILVVKRDSIKLSEIFETYREWICEDLDESEKYDLENFYVKFEKESNYSWYNIELGKEKPEKYCSGRDTVKFTLHESYNDKKVGWISDSIINGDKLKEKLKIGRLSSFEALIVNLTYNETPIKIDIDDEDDIDTSFDIDN